MLRLALPGLYLALAVYAWIDFVRLPKDGLANLGLLAVTFPVTVMGLILTRLAGGGGFVLLPDRFGYYVNHALYYWPSVGVTTLLIYLAARAFSR